MWCEVTGWAEYVGSGFYAERATGDSLKSSRTFYRVFSTEIYLLEIMF